MSNLSSILNVVGVPVLEQQLLPGRSASYAPIPDKLMDSVQKKIQIQFPNGLYSHQANALNDVLNGLDVCLATSTASGKSLVFASAATHFALHDPRSLTIAIYPARALVQDQVGKWREFTSSLGVKVGQIDGSIAVLDRLAILRESQIVAMTPDVIHAWLLNKLSETAPELRRLRLVVLDEAHIYNGVFGTNMAYLFRRLSVLAPQFQVIASTATIGDPVGFLHQLTGRSVTLYTRENEGSQIPPKEVVLSRLPKKGSFELLARLLRELADHYEGRFLAFADSRKLVERLTAAAHSSSSKPVTGSNDDSEDQEPVIAIPGILMPYRAGYESNDRADIQRALAEGKLRGVVSTSALEIGVDIGDIDLVVLLNTPPSVQAFWQRFGRAGRRTRNGECLFIDDTGTVTSLLSYLRQPVENNYLYLGNRFVQYTNALCAARELQEAGVDIHAWNRFSDLPQSFMPMLKNEVNPTEIVPDDLYPLKQRAEDSAHHEFPIRGGTEANFQVLKSGDDANLGVLSMAQLIKEAYPGAVYYYRATPYRIRETKMRERVLKASKERYITTQPNAQTIVFPKFSAAEKKWVSSEGFIVECQVQVAEQVLGFTERRGSSSETHTYGIGSQWSQRPVQRFLKTSGVVWSFGNNGLIPRDSAQYIVDSFCRAHGIHSRDVGWGRFSSNVTPIGIGDCKGLCIYDAVDGGLRLTEKLAENFCDILNTAITLAESEGDTSASSSIRNLQINALKLVALGRSTPITKDLPDQASEWIELIAPGQQAMLRKASETVEVIVEKFFLTPSGGIKYRLVHPKNGVDCTVDKGMLEPINGVTKFIRYNLNTGEEAPPLIN